MIKKWLLNDLVWPRHEIYIKGFLRNHQIWICISPPGWGRDQHTIYQPDCNLWLSYYSESNDAMFYTRAPVIGSTLKFQKVELFQRSTLFCCKKLIRSFNRDDSLKIFFHLFVKERQYFHDISYILKSCKTSMIDIF